MAKSFKLALGVILLGLSGALHAADQLCAPMDPQVQVTPTLVSPNRLAFSEIVGQDWMRVQRTREIPADEASLVIQEPHPTAVLAGFIAAHWRLPEGHATRVVAAACDAAIAEGVDPLLILAIAGRETGFRHVGNPSGGQDPKQPFGIMQVAGRWHPEKFENGRVRKTSLEENIALGAKVLRDYLVKAKGVEARALLHYVGSTSATWYVRAVKANRQLFKAALRPLSLYAE